MGMQTKKPPLHLQRGPSSESIPKSSIRIQDGLSGLSSWFSADSGTRSSAASIEFCLTPAGGAICRRSGASRHSRVVRSHLCTRSIQKKRREGCCPLEGEIKEEEEDASGSIDRTAPSS